MPINKLTIADVKIASPKYGFKKEPKIKESPIMVLVTRKNIYQLYIEIAVYLKS